MRTRPVPHALHERAHKSDGIRTARETDGKTKPGRRRFLSSGATRAREDDNWPGEKISHLRLKHRNCLAFPYDGLPILRVMRTNRCATSADAGLIASHRYACLRRWQERKLDPGRDAPQFVRGRANAAAGKYVGWIVLDGERPVASAGFSSSSGRRIHGSGERASRYLLNFWLSQSTAGRDWRVLW